MKFFDLRLPQRLALAALSSALVLPINKLDAMFGADTYVFVLSWWEILHGFAFGGLIMAAFIDTRLNRRMRVVAMMIASVLIYRIAIEAPDLMPGNLAISERTAFIISGTVGALLTAITTCIVGAFRVLPIYWLSVPIAGALGGFAFHYGFHHCDWDGCNSALDAVLFSSGWFIWQALVCTTIYLGRDRSHILRD